MERKPVYQLLVNIKSNIPSEIKCDNPSHIPFPNVPSYNTIQSFFFGPFANSCLSTPLICQSTYIKLELLLYSISKNYPQNLSMNFLTIDLPQTGPFQLYGFLLQFSTPLVHESIVSIINDITGLNTPSNLEHIVIGEFALNEFQSSLQSILFTAPFNLPLQFPSICSKWLISTIFRNDICIKWGVGREGIIFNMPLTPNPLDRFHQFSSAPFSFASNLFCSNSFSLKSKKNSDDEMKVVTADYSIDQTTAIFTIKNGIGNFMIKVFRFGLLEKETEAQKMIDLIDFGVMGFKVIPEEFNGMGIGKIDKELDMLVVVNLDCKYGFDKATTAINEAFKKAIKKAQNQQMNTKGLGKPNGCDLRGIGLDINRIANAMSTVLGDNCRETVMVEAVQLLSNFYFLQKK